MFISLVAFIVTSFPLLSRHFDLGIIPTIETFRKRMVKWRYIGAGIGMGFFPIGVIVMILVIKKLME
jgi:hypothetical protein